MQHVGGVLPSISSAWSSSPCFARAISRAVPTGPVL